MRILHDNANMEISKRVYDELVACEKINSERVHLGRITALDIRICKRRDNGGEFQMIDVIIRGSNGKLFVKSFSIDFMRKYLNQIKIEVEDIENAAVVFSVDRTYRNKVSFFAFIGLDEEASAEAEEDVYYIVKYEDEGIDKADVLKKLKALGL